MSHIITTNDDIKKVSECLNILRYRGYTKYTIYEVLDILIPKCEKYQIKSEITEQGYPAYFDGYHQLIHVSLKALEEFINKTIDSLFETYPCLKKQRNELFVYLVLEALCHEIEHAYQFMIGEEYVENPYKLVVDCYKNIANVLYAQDTRPLYTYIMVNRYKKMKDKPNFVLERNANLEAHDLLMKVSKYEQNLDMNRFASIQNLMFSACGYKKMKYNGSFEESYKTTWRGKFFELFDQLEEIPVEDRIRYALPIDNDSRKLLLQRYVSLKEELYK